MYLVMCLIVACVPVDPVVLYQREGAIKGSKDIMYDVQVNKNQLMMRSGEWLGMGHRSREGQPYAMTWICASTGYQSGGICVVRGNLISSMWIQEDNGRAIHTEETYYRLHP